MSDWNAHTIAEFRANEGKVGGVFEGAPIVLAHRSGRKSGRERVSPMMYSCTRPTQTSSISSQPGVVDHPPTRTGTAT
jgi:hypothetical protein